MAQWGPVSAAGDTNWNLSRPADFDAIGALVTEETIRQRIAVSADMGWHRARIEALMALGITAVHLHNVGRNQEAFIDAFGRDVLPGLR